MAAPLVRAPPATASAPEWLVPRGLPTEALVAHSMVGKFGDYLPFYRQADIYRRHGIELDRTMLAEWVKTGPAGIDPSSGRIEGMNARSAGRGVRRNCWPR